MRKITLNTFYQVLARFISSGTSFILTIFIARNLGVGQYSDFAKITAFVSLFYLLVDFGLNAIFLQKEKTNFKYFFYLRLVICLFIILFLNLISLILPYNSLLKIGFSNAVKLGILFFSLTVFTEGILNSSVAVFQKKLKYKYFFISTLFGSLLTIILIFGGLNKSLNDIIFAFIIGAVFESLMALFFTKENIFPPRLNLNFSRTFLKESYPIALMLFFNLVYFRIDMLILSFLKPNLAVAIYNLAYSFFDFLIALPLFLSNVLYVSLLENKKNFNLRALNRYLLIFFIFSLPIVLLVFLTSPFLRHIKQSFYSSSAVLDILVLFLPIFFVTSILQWILIAFKKQKFLTSLYFYLAIFNIVFNFLLIPKYSFFASAIITGVGEFIVLIFLYFEVLKEIKNAKP